MACRIVPVTGTGVAVGPVELAPYDHGESAMDKSKAERLFQTIDQLNEQLEDVREEFQWDDNPAGATIADHLARACEALGPAEWEIRRAYQLPELVD